MNTLLVLLWLASLVQIVVAAANFAIPRKLGYRENLAKVTPIIRQIFIVHAAYIVGVLLLFAALTLAFAPELASGRGLGRFVAAGIGLFWLFRAPVQVLYYDATLRRANRVGDVAFIAAAIFLAATYGAAALAHRA